ncbi:MAG: hypothetical protein FJY26_02785 [Betaproteobacteria bacterium]|nr:hypothetical protein [Betaproteobacteria bacterium]
MKTPSAARRFWPYTAARPAALGTATVVALGLVSQVAWAHEGHGAWGELHAHGDTLWGLAALAVAVLVGLVLGRRK